MVRLQLVPTNTTIEDLLLELATGTTGIHQRCWCCYQRGDSDNVFIDGMKVLIKLKLVQDFTGSSTGALTTQLQTLKRQALSFKFERRHIKYFPPVVLHLVLRLSVAQYKVDLQLMEQQLLVQVL